MSTEEIIQGNRSIAEFMGYTFTDKGLWYVGGKEWKTMPNGNHYARPDQLQYHISWDWLVPVVKKCYSIWAEKYKDNKTCCEIFDNLWSALWQFEIEDCFSEVVDFIKWKTESEYQNQNPC